MTLIEITKKALAKFFTFTPEQKKALRAFIATGLSALLALPTIYIMNKWGLDVSGVSDELVLLGTTILYTWLSHKINYFFNWWRV